MRLRLAACAAACGLLALAPGAHAAWPGANGKHVFTLVDLTAAQPQGDLWLMDAGGAHPRPLLTGPASDSEPSFAPNGRRIAFDSDRGDGGTSQVWTVRVDGGAPRQVTRARHGASRASWSPDGRRLVHTRLLGDPEDPRSREALYVVGAKGGRARRLTRPGPGGVDRFGQYSPDGRWIAFDRSRGDEPPSIWIVRARGGRPDPLIRVPGLAAQQPNWSPDGRRLAFMANLDRGEDSEIYVADADGRNRRALTDNEHVEFAPAFSPDGTQVSYTSCRGGDAANPLGNCDVYVIDPVSGRGRALTGSPLAEGQSDWQPLR